MEQINKELNYLQIVDMSSYVNNGHTKFPSKSEYAAIVMSDDCILQLGIELSKYAGDIIFVIGIGSIKVKQESFSEECEKRNLAINMCNIISEYKKKRPTKIMSMLLNEIYYNTRLQLIY